MISPPNDRSRPQAAPESCDGDTTILPRPAYTPGHVAPEWTVAAVIAGNEQFAAGYQLGMAHGRAETHEDRRRAVLHGQAAEVVRNAAKDLHVAELRRTA